MKAPSRVEAPAFSIISATVPTAVTFPRSMMAMRSHTSSISGRMWLLTNTVLPAFSARSLMRSRTTSEAKGSRAEVGSSRKIIGGSCISAAAMSTFCFMPRLNPSSRSSPLCLRSKSSSSRSARSFSSVRSTS
ncbi:MAG: hypothetical protein A4E30_01173 [Methanomassiliicoccales archaeon PtaB.Bin215]|nr:MAG: hypothetical protein A4E30_01173 [Methanomassiliicoccales archaeon PtaB.Bin215]